MARISFGRTVVKTMCKITYIAQDNSQKEAEVVLYGDYDISTAQKPAIKALGAKGGVVTEVKHKSFYGVISLEDFERYCTVSPNSEKEW